MCLLRNTYCETPSDGKFTKLTISFCVYLHSTISYVYSETPVLNFECKYFSYNYYCTLLIIDLVCRRLFTFIFVDFILMQVPTRFMKTSSQEEFVHR